MKLTFAKGASLKDPGGVFNPNLGARVRRAIDLQAEDELEEDALRGVISEAVVFSEASAADYALSLGIVPSLIVPPGRV